jgi:hypothetical protein
LLLAFLRYQPSMRVGDLCPSLVGALALVLRELARCGIGKGGFLASGRLGLRARPPLWLAMPLWIMAALRITLARLPGPGGVADDLSYSLPEIPATLLGWFSLSARLKEL